MQRKYEVIKLIKQDAGCHIVIDYVEGELFVFYLKNHLRIEKEQVFSWLKQIIRQLDSIQKMNGIAGYRYVTPYCMVVKEDKSIAFLDMKAESNISILKKMEQPAIRKLFFPAEEWENDCYSLGKTIQFLFAHIELEESLTKKEEYKFKKIISKCLKEHSKKSYQNISDILKDFPKRRKKKIWILPVILGVAVIVGRGDKCGEKTITQEIQMKEEDAQVLFDIGLMYFTEQEDYRKSKIFFEKSKKRNTLSAEYETLAKFMCGESTKSSREIEMILEQIETDNHIGKGGDIRYVKSLLQVYLRMDTRSAQKKIEELGKMVIENSDWKEEERELREVLAGIYTENQEYDKAIEEYKILCEWNKSETNYKMLIELYEKSNQVEKALKTCEVAMGDVPDGKEICVTYVRILCKSPEIEKAVVEKKIAEIVEHFPTLLQEEAFQKLQTEYGIKVEGENIWVEK